MDIATGILLTASLISAAKKLYELTFMIDDDPVKERKLKYKTDKFKRNSQTKHYFLTIEGTRIIDIQPID